MIKHNSADTLAHKASRPRRTWQSPCNCLCAPSLWADVIVMLRCPPGTLTIHTLHFNAAQQNPGEDMDREFVFSVVGASSRGISN